MVTLRKGLSVCALLLLTGAASAAVVYSTSFENPPFALGSINGQDSWANGSGTGQSQSIVNSYARTGTQSLMWDNRSTFNSFYSVRRAFDGQAGTITVSTPLEISVWLWIDPAVSQPERLYGLYATNSGTGTLGGTALGITISGDGRLRAGTTWSSTYSGPVLYQNPALVGNWVQLVLQYNGTGGKAFVFDSGANQLWYTSFASVSLANANGTGTNSWNINLGTDYNLTSDRAGLAYMDDLVVVPEPAGLVGALAALLMLSRRR